MLGQKERDICVHIIWIMDVASEEDSDSGDDV